MILFVTNAYPDFQGSYRGHFIRNLARRIQQAGWPVEIVTPRVFHKSYPSETDPTGFTVIRFKYPSGDKQLLHYEKVPYLRMLVFLLSGLLATIGVARSARFRIIHAHWVIPTGFIAVVVGSLMKIPVIVHARGTDMHTYAGRNPILRSITRWTLNAASILMATSEEIKQIMVKDFGIQSSKVHVIPTGIDTERFRPLDKFIEVRHQNHPPRQQILYVGELSDAKGVMLLLEAVQPLLIENPLMQLTLIGKGPLEAQIRKWASTFGLDTQVELTGSLSPEQIPEMLNRASVFVLPSLKEGLPNALLEALACGVPCIATRVGDIPLIIEDGRDALLVNPLSAEELSDSIKRLMEDQKLCQTLRLNGREKARSFDQDVSATRILKLYGELLGKKRL